MISAILAHAESMSGEGDEFGVETPRSTPAIRILWSKYRMDLYVLYEQRHSAG
jgi:hypothetical protein